MEYQPLPQTWVVSFLLICVESHIAKQTIFCILLFFFSFRGLATRCGSAMLKPKGISDCVPKYLSNSLLGVPRVLFQQVASAAFDVPSVHMEGSRCSNQISIVEKRRFQPTFLCGIYRNHFSHALIPNMQNFVAWIPPANPAWSSNHASDHTSEVDIKFVHIGDADAPGPSSKTSTWRRDGIKIVFLMDTFRLTKIDLLAKKVRFADCK